MRLTYASGFSYDTKSIRGAVTQIMLAAPLICFDSESDLTKALIT